MNSHENLQSSYETYLLATFKQEENLWILSAFSSFYFRDLLFGKFMPENSSFITPWRKEKKRYILISDIFPAAWKISHNLNSIKMEQGCFPKTFIHCYKLSAYTTYPTHLFHIFVSLYLQTSIVKSKNISIYKNISGIIVRYVIAPIDPIEYQGQYSSMDAYTGCNFDEKHHREESIVNFGVTIRRVAQRSSYC